MLKCYSDEFCLQILTSHTSLCNQWYNEVVFFMWESQVLNYFPLQKFTEPGKVELCLSPENTAVKRTPHSFIFWEQLAPKNHLSPYDWDTTCHLRFTLSHDSCKILRWLLCSPVTRQSTDLSPLAWTCWQCRTQTVQLYMLCLMND